MNGKVILINGTSSSGKTSLLHALQDLMEEPYLEAGIDKFIFMLPGRYLERPLWDEVLGLAERAGAAGHTLVKGMHRAILALSQSGVNVLADHVLVEAAWAQDCADLFAGLPAYLVGVQCPLEVLEARERSRKNRTLGQARLQYEVIHKYACYDLLVDSSVFSPLECARQVQSRLLAPPQALGEMKLRGMGMI
jgi:chloramphenicol 3-O phosphotransferase